MKYIYFVAYRKAGVDGYKEARLSDVIATIEQIDDIRDKIAYDDSLKSGDVAITGFQLLRTER